MTATSALIIGCACMLLGAGCASKGVPIGTRAHGSHLALAPSAANFSVDGRRESKGWEARRALRRATFIATEPPPAPTSQPLEMTPRRPAREAVWIGGHWAFTNHLDEPYEWRPGHWEISPPGRRTWVPDRWQQTENGWAYVRGHWE